MRAATPVASAVCWRVPEAPRRPSARLAVLFLLSLLAASPVAADGWLAIDGDTLSRGGERVRIENVDTPELHPCRCARECELGQRAAMFTQDALADATAVRILRTGRKDRYGRTIARVYVDGRDLGEMLIAAGLGRPYRGERRQSWCAPASHETDN